MQFLLKETSSNQANRRLIVNILSDLYAPLTLTEEELAPMNSLFKYFYSIYKKYNLLHIPVAMSCLLVKQDTVVYRSSVNNGIINRP